MKICFIQGGLAGGGAERKICTLANYFTSQGHTVSIGLYDNNDIAYDLDKRINVSFIGNKTNIISFIKEREDYVFITMLLHTYGYIMNIIDENNLHYVKDRYIVNECSVPYITGEDDLRYKYYPMARKVVAMNEGMKDCFIENIKSKTVIIPNPIKTDLPEPYFGERNKVVVTYSRLFYGKGLSLLINTFAKISLKYPDYKLEIYGQGILKNDLLKQIEDLNLTEKAFIYDFDPNVHEKIKQSAMFVSASEYEGHPNSLLEALAIGLPAISTDCDFGPRYMIKDHENGLLVPCNNMEALYNAMVEYIENPQLAINCGREAVKVRDKFSVEKIGNMWLELIEDVDKNH